MSRRGTAFISGVAVVDCRKAVAPEFNSAKRKRDSVKTNFLSGRLMSSIYTTAWKTIKNNYRYRKT